jgi:hypothetical protein
MGKNQNFAGYAFILLLVILLVVLLYQKYNVEKFDGSDPNAGNTSSTDDTNSILNSIVPDASSFDPTNIDAVINVQPNINTVDTTAQSTTSIDTSQYINPDNNSANNQQLSSCGVYQLSDPDTTTDAKLRNLCDAGFFDHPPEAMAQRKAYLTQQNVVASASAASGSRELELYNINTWYVKYRGLPDQPASAPLPGGMCKVNLLNWSVPNDNYVGQKPPLLSPNSITPNTSDIQNWAFCYYPLQSTQTAESLYAPPNGPPFATTSTINQSAVQPAGTATLFSADDKFARVSFNTLTAVEPTSATANNPDSLNSSICGPKNFTPLQTIVHNGPMPTDNTFLVFNIDKNNNIKNFSAVTYNPNTGYLEPFADMTTVCSKLFYMSSTTAPVQICPSNFLNAKIYNFKTDICWKANAQDPFKKTGRVLAASTFMYNQGTFCLSDIGLTSQNLIGKLFQNDPVIQNANSIAIKLFKDAGDPLDAALFGSGAVAAQLANITLSKMQDMLTQLQTQLGNSSTTGLAITVNGQPTTGLLAQNAQLLATFNTDLAISTADNAALQSATSISSNDLTKDITDDNNTIAAEAALVKNIDAITQNILLQQYIIEMLIDIGNNYSGLITPNVVINTIIGNTFPSSAVPWNSISNDGNVYVSIGNLTVGNPVTTYVNNPTLSTILNNLIILQQTYTSEMGTSATALAQVQGYLNTAQTMNSWKNIGSYCDYNSGHILPSNQGTNHTEFACAQAAAQQNNDTFGLDKNGTCWLGSSTNQNIPFSIYGTGCGNQTGNPTGLTLYTKPGVSIPNKVMNISGYSAKANTDYGGNDIATLQMNPGDLPTKCANFANMVNNSVGYVVTTDGYGPGCFVKSIMSGSGTPNSGRQSYISNPSAQIANDTLPQGKVLLNGMAITSANGLYTCRYLNKQLQVIQSNGVIVKTINTPRNSGSGGYIIMQSDANLVEYPLPASGMPDPVMNPTTSAVWASSWNGSPLSNGSYKLQIQNSRDLQILDANNNVKWSFGTTLPPPPPPPPPPPDYITGKYTLHPNTDYTGDPAAVGFSGFDLGYYGTKDPQQCAQYANQTGGALAFTVSTNTNECWVKGTTNEANLTTAQNYLHGPGQQNISVRQTYVKNNTAWTWTLGFSKGNTQGVSNTDIGKAAFDAKFNNGPHVILRKRFDNNQWEQIYYKRISTIPSGFSMYDTLLKVWASANNNMGTDFNLYSTLSDLQNDTNRFQFCNYDDFGSSVGAFRDCGKNSYVPWTWVAPNSQNPQFKQQFATGNLVESSGPVPVAYQFYIAEYATN